MEMEKIASELMDKMNSFGANGKPFVEQVLSEHKTLQQTFMSEIIIKFIKTVATAPNWRFDGRNEAMRNICQKLYAVLEEQYCQDGLPLI